MICFWKQIFCFQQNLTKLKRFSRKLALSQAISTSKKSPISSPFPSIKRVVIDSAPAQFYLSDIPYFFGFFWAMAGSSLLKKAGIVVLALPLTILMTLMFIVTLKFLPYYNRTTAYWRFGFHLKKKINMKKIFNEIQKNKLDGTWKQLDGQG